MSRPKRTESDPAALEAAIEAAHPRFVYVRDVWPEADVANWEKVAPTEAIIAALARDRDEYVEGIEQLQHELRAARAHNKQLRVAAATLVAAVPHIDTLFDLDGTSTARPFRLNDSRAGSPLVVD